MYVMNKTGALCTLDYYSASTVSFGVPFYAGVNVVASIETLLNVVYDCYQ